MNKKVIIGVIVVVVIVVLAMYMMRKKGTQSTTDTQSATTETKTETKTLGGAKSMKALLAEQGSQTCTFKSADGADTNEGSVYVANGKMRGDFIGSSGVTTTRSHMITDGKTSHVWMDGQSTGFKMSFEPSADTKDTTGPKTVDPNKQVDYKCSSWSVDSSKFELPAGVTFNDFSSMMVKPGSPIGNPSPATNSPADSMDNMKAMQLEACNQMAEPQKTQCMAALKLQ